MTAAIGVVTGTSCRPAPQSFDSSALDSRWSLHICLIFILALQSYTTCRGTRCRRSRCFARPCRRYRQPICSSGAATVRPIRSSALPHVQLWKAAHEERSRSQRSAPLQPSDLESNAVTGPQPNWQPWWPRNCSNHQSIHAMPPLRRGKKFGTALLVCAD